MSTRLTLKTDKFRALATFLTVAWLFVSTSVLICSALTSEHLPEGGASMIKKFPSRRRENQLCLESYLTFLALRQTYQFFRICYLPFTYTSYVSYFKIMMA